MKSIYTEFLNKGLIFDKTTQSLSSLPYEISDLKIKANDFVTFSVYNEVVKKLYYNMLFLYRACNVADFKVFNTYVFSISSQNNNGFKTYIKEGNYYSTENNILSSTIDAVLINTRFSNNQLSYLICMSEQALTVLSMTNEGSTGVSFTNTLVGSLSSEIRYGKLVDIKTSGDDNLYVVDSKYGNIYHYDIRNLNTDENIFNKKFVLKGIIGGQGGITDKNKFNEIKNIAVNDQYVVVQDYKNKCFKVFDKNLNWVSTNIFTKIFNKLEFFTCILLGKNNELYCGKDKSIFKFNFINNELVLEKEYFVGSYLKEEEIIKNLKLFQTDGSVIYVITQKSVKKIWVTVLDYIIGQNNVTDNVDIKWLTTTKTVDNKDILTIYSGNESVENFSYFYDNININSLLRDNSFFIYTMEEDLFIRGDEYVQSWVMLKNFKKIYYNLLLLIQNLNYVYKEENLGNNYPSIKEKLYNFNILGYFNEIKFEDNFDIGVNEILQSDVLNRCINQVVELQQIIMLYLISNLNDTVYYSPEPEKIKPSARKYFYFADESLIMSPNPVKLDIFQSLAPGAGIVASLGGAPFEGINGISIKEGVEI
jgi:hypothetical protein